VNTYDPADSILYVHMALDSTRALSRLAAGEAEVSTSPSPGTVATGHDRRVRQVAALATRSPDAPGRSAAPGPSER
jgi:hypothetical protein